MKTSDRGIELIKRHEGFRSRAYLCPAGVWTIGYGHTGGVKSGDVVTEAQADVFLRADLNTAERAVNSQMLDVNQNQFDALVSFVFNVGGGNFASSTLLKIVRNHPGDLRIKAEFNRWIYAKSRVLPGLVLRRREEADLYFDK